MVVQKDLTDDDIDRLFHALAAATRRDIAPSTLTAALRISYLPHSEGKAPYEEA